MEQRDEYEEEYAAVNNEGPVVQVHDHQDEDPDAKRRRLSGGEAIGVSNNNNNVNHGGGGGIVGAVGGGGGTQVRYSDRESICGKKIWSPDDDAKLLELVETLGRQEGAWPEIAAGLPGRTVRSCRARWFRAILPSLDDARRRNRPGLWTLEEDAKLQELVEKFGRNWKRISQEMGNRTPDACDIHWYGVVCKRNQADGTTTRTPRHSLGGSSSSSSGNGDDYNGNSPAGDVSNRKRWTVEEEAALWHLVETYGTSERAWPIISNTLGRSCCSCKGHFYAVSSKRGPPPPPQQPTQQQQQQQQQMQELMQQQQQQQQQLMQQHQQQQQQMMQMHGHMDGSDPLQQQDQQQQMHADQIQQQQMQMHSEQMQLQQMHQQQLQQLQAQQQQELAAATDNQPPLHQLLSNQAPSSATGADASTANVAGGSVASPAPAASASSSTTPATSAASLVTVANPDEIAAAINASDIRRRWSAADEKQLKQLVDMKTNWTIIGATFGRTEEACKKHYSKAFPSTNGTAATAAAVGAAALGADAATVDPGAVDQNGAAGDKTSAADAPGSASATPTKWMVKSLKRWTYEEDEALRQLVENYGRKNWGTISSKLAGRSADACECRWRDKLYPKLLSLEKELRDQIIQQDEEYAATSSSSGGVNAASSGAGASQMHAHALTGSQQHGQGDTPGGQEGRLSLGSVGASGVASAAASPMPNDSGGNPMTTTQVRWSAAEDEQLKQLIATYGSSGQQAWDKVASLCPGRSVHSCRMRWKQALRHLMPGAMGGNAPGSSATTPAGKGDAGNDAGANGSSADGDISGAGAAPLHTLLNNAASQQQQSQSQHHAAHMMHNHQQQQQHHHQQQHQMHQQQHHQQHAHVGANNNSASMDEYAAAV